MAGKSYDALNFRKTPQAQRGTYTYEFADGQRVTITPDEQGCTEIDIRVRRHRRQRLACRENRQPGRMGIREVQRNHNRINDKALNSVYAGLRAFLLL